MQFTRGIKTNRQIGNPDSLARIVDGTRSWMVANGSMALVTMIVPPAFQRQAIVVEAGKFSLDEVETALSRYLCDEPTSALKKYAEPFSLDGWSGPPGTRCPHDGQ